MLKVQTENGHVVENEIIDDRIIAVKVDGKIKSEIKLDNSYALQDAINEAYRWINEFNNHSNITQLSNI